MPTSRRSSILLIGITVIFTLYRVDGASVPEKGPVPLIPTSDGLLHFYMLPIGQGDSEIIQCPNGDLTIMDLGQGGTGGAGFWNAAQVSTFLAGQFNLIKNVIISHNHPDHTSFLPTVLSSAVGLPALTHIYVSCNESDMAAGTVGWINDIQGRDKLHMFNGGLSCGANGIPCGAIDLCPGDSDVTATVFAANMGNCASANRNHDSIVFKVTHNDVTIMFNGDFEDAGTEQNENGHQKAVADYYGDQLHVTALKLGRHGAQTWANKLVYLEAHQPKAVFVTASVLSTDPRCDVFDRLINIVGTLCKPGVIDPLDSFYCGEHPDGNVVLDDKLQKIYTCGEASLDINDGWRYVIDNEYAIYTTTPNAEYLNLVMFSSDGTKWGFTNNIQLRTPAK